MPLSMIDPTYVKTEIEAKPEWQLAWALSEIMNDSAPIGWSRYIWVAECLLASFDIKRKPEETKSMEDVNVS